jgi:hypothetical protein
LTGERAAAADEDLAAQARDPTAAITAFQIRYDWTASLHNLPNQDLGTVVVQPVIPFKIGEQRHIARITASYVTNAPDLAGLGGSIDQNPIPPNYIPTSNVRGLGDTSVVDVMLFDRDWGRIGFGGALSVPTASNSALGTGKWWLGPAVVGIGRGGKWQSGLLGMGLFSFAGQSSRQSVSALTPQPFASYALGGNWSVGLSDVSYT